MKILDYVAFLSLAFVFPGCSPVSDRGRSTGPTKPADVSQRDWEATKQQFRSGTGASNKEAESAADAIYKFEKARRARGEK